MKKRSGNYPEQRKRKRRRIIEFIQNLKLNSFCKDCNSTGQNTNLTFDHVRGKKLFHLARAARRSMTQTKLEIEKCDLVCRNCHDIREYKRGRMNQVIGIDHLEG